MKLHCLFAFGIISFIATCGAQTEMDDPQTLSFGSDKGQFTFKSPDGYCIERPSLRTMRGQLNAEVEFTEVIASNCEIVDGISKMTEPVSIISTSISATASTLDEEIELLSGVSPLELEATEGGYLFSQDDQGISTTGFVTKIGNYLVYIRVSNISANSNANARELLAKTYQALLASNL